MTRRMPLWGIALSLVLGWGSLAFAQEPPVSAANDSLTTTGEEAAPGEAVAPGAGAETPQSAAADTTVVRKRRMEKSTRYYFNLGVGSAINYLPDSFKDSYDPAFGLRIGGGVARDMFQLGVTISYNFFFSNAPTELFPDDLNILTIFGDLKVVPVGKSIKPYLLVCGGYYRQWIVDTGMEENVLGYGAGVGVDLELDRTRHLYIEGRYVQGQTRETTEDGANTEMIPFTLGVAWVF